MQGRIRIVSDGTPRGTRVLLPNGDRMPGLIKKVEWSITAGEPHELARAVITFANVEIEAEGGFVLAPSPEVTAEQWQNAPIARFFPADFFSESLAHKPDQA